ncbi:hypothetical protein SK128_002517 [Halocaridina rubra]|uniref:Uncharacterized protein n=1 Tax=Halocaridina rubra TaxID=373956 RepID=A0AAN8WIG5_HALRR
MTHRGTWKQSCFLRHPRRKRAPRFKAVPKHNPTPRITGYMVNLTGKAFPCRM